MAEDLDAIFQEHCDGEGMTDRQAWQAVCMTGRNPTSMDIKSFWEEKGVAEGDPIDCDQFKELVERIPEPSVEAMEEALRKFDKDESGYIEKEELINILKQSDDLYGTAFHEDDEYLEQLIEQGDAEGNQDGKLDIKELAQLIVTGGVTV